MAVVSVDVSCINRSPNTDLKQEEEEGGCEGNTNSSIGSAGSNCCFTG